MAQSGYPAFYQQPTYSYPSQAPPPPGPAQAYDARGIPQYTSQYQQSPYPCPPTSPQQPYGYATPPVQRPPSRINPSPVLVSQVGPPSQYPRPPPSPQLYNAPASNPYPSPVSPQTPHTGTPQSSRRPLPTPRNLPAPPNSAGLPPPNVPQPPTSPQPAYATHRPTQSVPSVFPAYPQPHVNTYPVAAREPSPSPTSSAFSATSTSPPRPLPLPRSAGTFDLSSAPAQHNEPRPQSPPKRALPAPQPLQTHDSSIQSPEPVSASGQKFVPLWKRALPQPGASPSRVLPSPSETRPQGSVERRSTVSSGGSRPLPPSPSNANGSVVGLPRDPLARAEQSFSRPPPTAPPAAGPSNPSTSPSTSPPSSRFMLRERSRTLPLPSAAPTYPLPPKPGQPPSPSASNVTGQPLSQSPHSSDDEELTNALLERHQRSPSPQFGIRDLPRNTAGQSRSIPGPMNAHANGDSTPRARRDLPSPGTGPQNQSAGQLPSRSQSGDGESSLAFRMAAVSLQGQSQSQPPAEAQAQPFRPGHAPSRQSQPPPQTAQQQRSGWPSNLPPLPRAPVSPQPGAQSSFASQAQAQAQGPAETRSRPLPVRSNTASANVTPFGRPRSPRKADLDLNLDDAPPPSLRRSPAPSGNTQAQPSFMNSRAGSSRAGASLQRAPSQNTTASVFSLSAFPKPPSHVESPNPPSPTKFGFRPPSPAKQWQDNSNWQSSIGTTNRTQPPPPSPTKQWQTTITSSRSQPQPPSPTKQWQDRSQPPPQPQPPSPTKTAPFTVRAPSPTKYTNPPSFAVPEQRTQPSPRIPKISFPASLDGDSDEDDIGGPVINISGPSDSRRSEAPSIPRISFGDDDDDQDNGLPSINIGGADDDPPIPQISLPGEPSSPSRRRKDQPQTRRVEETLANPRLEAAKRSGLVCGGCGGPIIGRIVSAMDMRWHPGCFRCCVCDELLENLSSYAHDGRPYCHLDYHETTIVDERFITLDDPELGKRTYHEQHFFCAECGDPFLPPSDPGAPSRTFAGDGEFAVGAEDDVGFTVYKGHPYCEACHVRLRMPKCKKCKKSIRHGMQAVEALGGKWCWECFTCANCDKPFEVPAFFQRDGKPFCEHCFSIMIRNEI
ncbi:hypothetical protein ONZ51_g7497 [Trametes cubensis]|uniref:LIM zinc-binding domain-containing protein n=1 Tax=Trametes cubensis TaxID=1111947 RepID=A0AAD7TQ32_9APHY|nr:hypothetical protein ONZ51_g7497 [Trametes cubensis]